MVFYCQLEKIVGEYLGLDIKRKVKLLFHLINSLNCSTFIGILLIAIAIGILTLVKYRKEKAPWKAVLCIAIFEMIILIINRLIKEYMPDTSLYQISLIITFICGGIFLLSIFIGAYITQRNSR